MILVCHRCKGEGKRLVPDCSKITNEIFAPIYMVSVQCQLCSGNGLLDVNTVTVSQVEVKPADKKNDE